MRFRQLILNTLLMVASIMTALVVGELVIRLLMPVYDYADRSLLFSSPTFKLYSGGSVRYLPNVKIREIAVYHEKVEYDVLYSTNNLGFIDSRNYGREAIPGKSYYAIVGDSFTAGVNGGNPWVPALRNNRANAEVYNFGVAGTGFEQFYTLLHDMKDKVSMTHIVLVAITDDFFRSGWHPVVKDGIINFCHVSGVHSNCQPMPVAAIIRPDASGREVMEISRARYKEIRARIDEINAVSDSRSVLEKILYDKSVIYYYSRLLYDTYRRSHQPGDIGSALMFMQQIRSEFPAAEIHLIHLPQKYEVKTKQYYISVADQISALGIRYYPALEKCSWSMDMFFERDAHPNRSGYDNIAKCVSGYLFH